MKVTQDNIADAILCLRGSSVLAVDTETTGLSETDKAFAVIIANAFGVYYFDERVVPNVFEELRVLFATTPARLVFQNTKFDIRMLESIGIIPHSVSDWYDLTSMARIVRNDHMEYNLAAQAKRYGMQKLDGPLKKYIKDNNLFEERTNFFGEVEKQPRYDWVPVDIMCEYALMDARITFALYQIYLKLLDDSELKLAHDEAILNKVCYRMERLGMRVDTDKVFEAMSFEGEMVEEKQLQYLELTNAEFVNSAKSLQKVLSFELPKTDKGNPSADAVVLEGLLTTAEGRDAEIIRLVLDIRTYEKRISTYYRNYLIMKDKNNVIHPQMWIAGTKTGRFSYSDPNLQNISKDDPDDPSPERYSVRECFVPREGRVFISLDYSQMEYRMAADYAGETKVIEAVMNGADFHQATADMVGINRKPAKTLNFACIAEGEKVLTNNGLKPIETVDRSDLVWDGVEYVTHEGVVFNGEKDTITYQGLTATADHIVFTECGRQVPFGDVATQLRPYRIITTEINGHAIGVVNTCATHTGTELQAPKDTGPVLPLSKNLFIRRGKYTTEKNNKLHVHPWFKVSSRRDCKEYFNEKILVGAHAVYVSAIQELGKLWGAWYTGAMHPSGVPGLLHKQLYTRGDTYPRCRPHQQYGALRTGEHAPSSTMCEPTQQKKKVYDILNCGPRNRFTVSGVLVHNCLYGAGTDKIATMLGCTRDEAKRLLFKYFLNLAKIERLIDGVIATGKARGFVFNWAGRKLYAAKEFCYALPNHLIQGGGADVVKEAMRRIYLDPELGKLWLVLQVHDQLVFELLPEELVHIPRIKEIMESVYPAKNGMKLTVDVSISHQSLAEKHMRKYDDRAHRQSAI